MDELAERTRQYIVSLGSADMQNKEAIQDVLLARKLENLKKRSSKHGRIERKALGLLGRVDYTKIEPRIAWVAPKDLPLWKYYRDILSSAPFDGRPGRVTFGFVIDGASLGILGIFEIGSDMSVLGPRDKHIGWQHHDRFAHGMLRHVFNLGTCVCSQPFGWLTGGKLIASCMATSDVSELWRRRYGDELAAGVTTSLYGKSSQYERLKRWKYLGNTKGSIGIAHMNKNGRQLIKQYCDTLPPSGTGRSHSRAGAVGGYANTLNYFINACKGLGVAPSDYSANQPRGVYFSAMANNACAYLRRETDNLSVDANTIAEEVEFWHGRWYQMRLPKKIEDIETFDYNWYSLSGQMRYIAERLRGPSVTGDTSDHQSEGAGSIPAVRSENHTGQTPVMIE